MVQCVDLYVILCFVGGFLETRFICYSVITMVYDKTEMFDYWGLKYKHSTTKKKKEKIKW